MGAFTGLSYNFRTGAAGDGRSLIMYCAHEDDYGPCGKDITDDIFSVDPDVLFVIHNDHDFASYSEEDIEELKTYLPGISMFVFVVTEKFLRTDNIARLVEFNYAVENRIPIMPIMPHTGLEGEFNDICGNLQVLDRSSTDPTVIPYDEKIRKMLKSAIAGEELAERVKNSFKRNIFLSYRKKDRRCVETVRAVIHAEPRLWSTGIWYDEFLTPGEDFNESIMQAFNESECFVLLVTPNLLEEGNYVMTVEYPLARKAGVKIVAVEAVETDREKLAECYPGLTRVWKVSDGSGIRGAIDGSLRDRNALAARLHSRAGAMPEIDPDMRPEELPAFLGRSTGGELYLLGAAYLYGINCEKDFEKARCLLTASYVKKYPKAADLLEQIYSEGIGTEIMTGRQNFWCRRLFNMVTDRANRDNPDFEDYRDMAKLIEVWHRMIASDRTAGRYGEALEIQQSLIWRIIPETEGVDMTPFRPHTAAGDPMQKKTAYSVADYQVLPLEFPWKEFSEAAPKFPGEDVIDILEELVGYAELLQLCGFYGDAWLNISDYVSDMTDGLGLEEDLRLSILKQRCGKIETEYLYRSGQLKYLGSCAMNLMEQLNERVTEHEEDRDALRPEYHDLFFYYICSEIDRAGANEECLNDIDDIIAFWKDRYEATHRFQFLKKQIESFTLKFKAFEKLDRAYAEEVDENEILKSIVDLSTEQTGLARDYAEKFRSGEAYVLYADALNNYVSIMLKVADAYKTDDTENMEWAAELAVHMAGPDRDDERIISASRFISYCTALLNYARVLRLKKEDQKAAECCRKLLDAYEDRRKWYMKRRGILYGGRETAEQIVHCDWSGIYLLRVGAGDILTDILAGDGDADGVREEAYRLRDLSEELDKDGGEFAGPDLTERFIYPFIRYSWAAFYTRKFNDSTEFAYRAAKKHISLFFMTNPEFEDDEENGSLKEKEIEVLTQILIPDELTEMIGAGDDPNEFATQAHMNEAGERARKNAEKIFEDSRKQE